jgi:hypothetical protein
MNDFLFKGIERATFLPVALLCALNERWRSCFLIGTYDEAFQNANTSLNFDPLTDGSETLKEKRRKRITKKHQTKHQNHIHLNYNFREVL